MSIDTEWFQQRIRESRYPTLRALAPHLGMHFSSLSLALAGRRRFRPDELADLAKALSLPLQDVLERAGIKTGSSRRAPEPLPNVPADIRRDLSRLPAKDPLWPALRALLKLRYRHRQS